MFEFRDAIMFRCVWWGSMMRNAMYLKKIFESCKFTSIIGIEGDDFMLEIIFNNGFKAYESRLDIRFALQRIEPCITCKMIYKTI
jgi:hypothetical protein